MLEIAICDDDAIILKTLGKYFGKLNDATIKYDIYNSADTLYRDRKSTRLNSSH